MNRRDAAPPGWPASAAAHPRPADARPDDEGLEDIRPEEERTDEGSETVWLGLSMLARPSLAARYLTRGVDGRPRHLRWDDLRALAGSDGPPLFTATDVRTAEQRALTLASWARRRGIRLVGWSTPAYPERFRTLGQPPPILWVEGRSDLNGPAVAIVGARAASPAALSMARDLGRDLAAAGLIVVSGFALGVDGAAHEGALAAGHTVAVLGTGIDGCYPRRNRALGRRIATAGTLVTEFLPGTPPLAHHFPLRNRLVAGLSIGVVVVEAAAQSGALITAHAALDQGKEVMVVPGLACSGRNTGGHALIKDGAALVENSADVIDMLAAGPLRRWTSAAPTTSGPSAPRSPLPDAGGGARGGPPGSAGWLDRLFREWRRGEELDLDELSALSGVAADRLLASLLEWELSGAIARTPGGRFVRQ